MKNNLNYFEGIGRRKTATARVRVYNEPTESKGKFIINGSNAIDYFKVLRYQNSASEPLKVLGGPGQKMKVESIVKGGGIMAQSEAIKLGLARAILGYRPELKSELRSLGYLTRDSRMVERKKYGLRKARRASQWKKR
ncbi:MAG: 30S ribosomal protein S9 [Candidatus Colwellbacteria bacterium]|nr:30S ribosomal protein S9 [Candidatus Colwellbacteria bacterium]